METNAEKYIDAYKKLETVLRSMYGLRDEQSISYFIQSDSRNSFMKNEIAYCQQVRNLLQHRERISSTYPIEPTDEMLNYLNNAVERLRNRPRCLSIAIKGADVFSASPDDGLRTVMAKMRKHAFTHVPILQDGKVIGVLSEHSVFNYLTDEGIVDIDGCLALRDLKSYTAIDKNAEEVFSFQPASKYADELLDVFEQEFKRGRRLGMVFLTSAGLPDERLLGILTP